MSDTKRKERTRRFIIETQKEYGDKVDLSEEIKEDVYRLAIEEGVSINNALSMRNILKEIEDFSPYQSVTDYVFLRNVVSDIHTYACNELRGYNTSGIMWGTINMMEFSAFICSSREIDDTMFFTSGLVSLAINISIIFSTVVPISFENRLLKIDYTDVDKIAYTFQKSTYTIFFYVMFMFENSRTHESLSETLLKADESLKILASIIYDCFLRFVVAHEYSHHLLNHTVTDIDILAKNKNDRKLLKVPQEHRMSAVRWKRETDADELAAHMTINSQKFSHFSHYGIAIALKMMEFFNGMSVVTHPPVSIRRSHLFDCRHLDLNYDVFTIVDSVFDKLLADYRQKKDALMKECADVSLSNLSNVEFQETVSEFLNR